jgi:hypothetical protein
MTVFDRDSRLYELTPCAGVDIEFRGMKKSAMNGRTVLSKMARVGFVVCASACGSQPMSLSPTQPQPLPSPPAPQRTIHGLVREVNGGGLGDVTIRALSQVPGDRPVPIGSTAADGSFRFEQFAQNYLSFSKTGYESAGWSVPQNAKPDETFTIVIKMQPTLLLTAGRPVESVITADDLAYSSQGEGDSIELDWPGNVLCSPCKFIFVPADQTPRKGGTLRLSSRGGPPLTMWVADYYSGPILVVTGRPGETELVVDVPAERSWNTVLVGLDRRNGPPISGDTVITFRLALVAS